MRFTNSLLTLAASLLVVLMFVVTFNAMTGSSLSAGHLGAIAPLPQVSTGNLLPNQEDDDWDEGDDEQSDGDGENQDDDDWNDEDQDRDDDWDDDMDDDDDMDMDDGWGQEGEDQDDDDWSDEEFEMDRMEIESNIGRLETISRLAEIAQDDTKMASYAIMHLSEFMEDEEEAIQLLKDLIDSEKVSRTAKNLLKMKLAEVYSMDDRREEALEVFKSMLMSR